MEVWLLLILGCLRKLVAHDILLVKVHVVVYSGVGYLDACKLT